MSASEIPEKIRVGVMLIRVKGMCGAWSPDLERVCVRRAGEEHTHDWDPPRFSARYSDRVAAIEGGLPMERG